MTNIIEKKKNELYSQFKLLCPNVYFQPPESLKINYPAIVYSLDRINNEEADNLVYLQSHYFRVTVIDKSPISYIADNLSRFPNCSSGGCYPSNNYNHYKFNIQIL